MEDMKQKEKETREFFTALKELPSEQAEIFRKAVIGRAAFNAIEKFYKPVAAVCEGLRL